MFSKFFIERPVLANVIACLMILLGGVAILQLPISQYPPITPPTIQVTASYPGASARTVVDTVALPIEEQVNGVEGMLYMQSSSTNDGHYTLIVTFQIGTDPDFAQVLVQNRVAAALAQLPRAAQEQGVVTKKKSTAILQIITLTSPKGKYDALFLSNYATLSLQNELERLPGVGDVNIFGIGQYSMRIWLNPEKMQQLSLSPSEVIATLQRQNSQVTAGQIGMPPAPGTQDFQYTLNVHGALNAAEEFEQIIVKTDNTGGATHQRRRRRPAPRDRGHEKRRPTRSQPHRSPGLAISRVSNSAPRHTASSSTTTASLPAASRSISFRRQTPSTLPMPSMRP